MAPVTRRRLWELVDPETKDRWGRRVEAVVFVLALSNVVAVVLASVESLYSRYTVFFEGFLTASMILFTLLYVARVWAAASGTEHGTSGRLRFARRPIAVIDFVVVSTFWLGLLTGVEALGAGLFRTLWVVRIFSLSLFKRSRGRFRRVLSAQREDLAIAFSAAGMLVLVSSTLMYFVEGSAQPDAFSSIPAALWWGVVTLTTVGYGDVVPITPLGRFLGALTTFGGVAFFALPSSILAAGFFAERAAEREQMAREHLGNRCPHCGESLETTLSLPGIDEVQDSVTEERES
jgi:voltage-gated potassium channel